MRTFSWENIEKISPETGKIIKIELLVKMEVNAGSSAGPVLHPTPFMTFREEFRVKVQHT